MPIQSLRKHLTAKSQAVIQEATKDEVQLGKLLNDSSSRLRDMEQKQANLKKGLMARFFPPKESKELAKKIEGAKANVSEIEKKLATTRDLLAGLDEEKAQPQKFGPTQDKAELERLQNIKKDLVKNIQSDERVLAGMKAAEKNKSLKEKLMPDRGKADELTGLFQGGNREFQKDELKSAKEQLDFFERKIDALQRKMDYRQNLERKAEQAQKNSQHVKTGDAAHLSPHKPGISPHHENQVG